MRDIGRSAPHVEADDFVEARGERCAYCADDAAGRAGEYRILALETSRVREAAGGLHEHQLHVVQFPGDAVDIAAENWRQICVDDCGIAATDELHERPHFV